MTIIEFRIPLKIHLHFDATLGAGKCSGSPISWFQGSAHFWRSLLCPLYWRLQSIWRTHAILVTALHLSPIKTSWAWPATAKRSPEKLASRRPLETWIPRRQDLMQSCKLPPARWVLQNEHSMNARALCWTRLHMLKQTWKQIKSLCLKNMCFVQNTLLTELYSVMDKSFTFMLYVN